MSIIQTFYDSLASHYDKLFSDWQATAKEQATLLRGILAAFHFDLSASILDCACGIGTQAIGLASLGYSVCASDISEGALAEAKARATAAGVDIRFAHADFCALSEVFSEHFDVVIAMDNALPHMLTHEDLARAVGSITAQLKEGGIFVGSIRDYDALLQDKPPYSPPYIHETERGRRVCFQTWLWEGDRYKLTQYIIEDGIALTTHKFECEYRATRKAELTALFEACGAREIIWMLPEETGFYQPILIVRK